ncbi:MAG TPA: hypothetical protein VGG02_03920 [Chthoniobacterales bacterium]|jgi:hypothetical protein
MESSLFQVTSRNSRSTEKLTFFPDRIEREWSTMPWNVGNTTIPKATLGPLLGSQRTFGWGFRRPFFEFLVLFALGLMLHEGFDRPVLRICGLVFYALAALKLIFALLRLRHDRWLFLQHADGRHLLTLRVSGLQDLSEEEFKRKFAEYMRDVTPAVSPKA